jgi:hypothetical protein
MADAVPPYRATHEPLSDALRDRAAAAWRTAQRRETGTPLQNVVGLVVGIGGLGAVIGTLPMLGGKPYAIAAPFGLTAVGAALSALVVVRTRHAARALDAEVAALGAVGEVVRHALCIDGAHRFMPHEHGVVVLVRLDAARCVAFDVSSVADDPRHEPIDEALRANAVPRIWQWVETPDGVLLDFSMSGDPIVPVIGEEGWVLDDAGPFQQVIDTLHDGSLVVALDFDAVVARAEATAG